MITENEFFYVLKDIAVSLREIAFALKNNNSSNEGVAQHDVNESIASVDKSVKSGVSKEISEENADINRIMSEKPSKAELSSYGRIAKPKKKPFKRHGLKFKNRDCASKETDGGIAMETVSAKSENIDVFSKDCTLTKANSNPDSDFE